tara:strand:+ start:121 stop:372 length:252 start_codon:yes stop_codon:yes gene_type:complete
MPKPKKIQAKYKNSKVEIKDFFDWLEVEESGRNWFIQHHLSDLTNLIGINNKSFKAVDDIDKYLHQAFKAKATFIRYGKEVYL